jgi:hypothetical protein
LGKGGHSQEVQRIGLRGLKREDAAVETLCLIESPGLMMRERLLQTGDDQDRPLPAVPCRDLSPIASAQSRSLTKEIGSSGCAG